MAEEYSLSLLNQSVARTCVALGFKEASMPCIETLSDVVRFYIEMIAEKSVNQAETSGRAVVGLQDVLSVLGNTSSMKKSSWKELRDFAFEADGTPKWSQQFPHDVPNYPARQLTSQADTSALEEEGPVRDTHVPPHLPHYPPSRTYKRSYGKKRSAPDEKDDRTKRITTIKNVQASLAKIENSADNTGAS